jgi:hypothetical protein
VGFVGQEVGAGHVAWKFVEMEGAVGGPLEDLEVDLVGSGGGAPVPVGDEFFAASAVFFSGEGAGGDIEERGLGVVDGFAVDLKPLAHLLEAFDLGCGDDAVRVGADVEVSRPEMIRDGLWLSWKCTRTGEGFVCRALN